MASPLTIQAKAKVTDGNGANDQVNTAYNGATFQIGESSLSATVTRALIKFDLSEIPSDATITSAVMSLKLYDDRSSNARTFRVYRVKRAWVEGQACWNTYSTGNNWGTAMCANTTSDRESADIGSADFTATETLGTWKDFALTASKIQEMITGGVFTNNGFLIQADTENYDAYQFYSSDNGTEADNPKLVVTYTLPSSGSAFFNFM